MHSMSPLHIHVHMAPLWPLLLLLLLNAHLFGAADEPLHNGIVVVKSNSYTYCDMLDDNCVSGV